MAGTKSFEQRYLEATYTTQDQRDKAEIDWALLEAIAEDHEANKGLLNETAETFARTIQKMDKVHSVRYRVKDTWHLIDKIVRKRAEKKEKYIGISVDSYSTVITDLVGLRVLHLFKGEILDLRKQLDAILDVKEGPIVFIREGDDSNHMLSDLLQMEVEVHPAGYRSVHYIADSRIFKKSVKIEIQVRTIYEEAWSEVDHKIRYPHKVNPLIEDLLLVLNRVSGSADEMSTNIQLVHNQMVLDESNLLDTQNKLNKALDKMEKMAADIDAVNQDKEAVSKQVKELKDELSRVRSLNGSTGGIIAKELAARYGISGETSEKDKVGIISAARRASSMNPSTVSASKSLLSSLEAANKPAGKLAASVLKRMLEEDKNAQWLGPKSIKPD